MSRFINPVPEYRPNSQLFFYKSGTNSQLVTYADENQNIPNAQPVLTDALGNCPNIFYSGSAKLKVLDENGVQYIERDPVGGEKELGDFTLWDTTVIYDINDIVEGSDGNFYRSLSNGNQSNDPVTDATQWEQINFIGAWNANIIYSIGDIVKTANGNLWKAQTATAGNEPSTDDGTNWLPSIDGAKLPQIQKLEALNQWVTKSADFTAVNQESYQIDGSSTTVDITIPTIAEGDSFIFYNHKDSTNKVQILNPSYTINGASGTVAAGTDLELEPSNAVQLVAKTTTVLEIVGAQA